ncbi:MAG: transporter [Gammaproteobacteria bacterium]|nr:MAG: transporter [Gammaproteobacteria bacterium]
MLTALSALSLTIILLSLASIIGLWIGHWRLGSVSLGVGGVLFGGIIVGHIVQSNGIVLDMNIMQFVQEFGLILFVYTVGVQVGPGFFSSLRKAGLKLNAVAVLSILLSSITAVVIFMIADIKLPAILGILSGAVTNTPALGAGSETLRTLGLPAKQIDMIGTGYTMAYPFGICGLFLVMWLLRIVFRIHLANEAKDIEKQNQRGPQSLRSLNVLVSNPNLDGVKLSEMPMFEQEQVVCSRIKRGEKLTIPSLDTTLRGGDYLHIVGTEHDLNHAVMFIGEVAENVSLTTKGTELSVVRVVVTNEAVLNKRIRRLHLKKKYDVVISRINRAGIELVPSEETALQFGDVLNLVGKKEAIDEVAALVGNAEHKLIQAEMLPVFIGILLGVILGSLPIVIPGLPVPLKLGLAGGPLIIAIFLGRLGSLGKLYWFMPPSANLALRELGITLFIAVVGIKSGGNFVETLVHGDGLLWAGYGALITAVPLMITGLLGRMVLKLNYLSLCGALSGSMTSPYGLAFGTAMYPTSGEVALSYATVYPLSMFLRIMMPQILAIILWASMH